MFPARPPGPLGAWNTPARGPHSNTPRRLCRPAPARGSGVEVRLVGAHRLVDVVVARNGVCGWLRTATVVVVHGDVGYVVAGEGVWLLVRKVFLRSTRGLVVVDHNVRGRPLRSTYAYKVSDSLRKEDKNSRTNRNYLSLRRIIRVTLLPSGCYATTRPVSNN